MNDEPEQHAIVPDQDVERKADDLVRSRDVMLYRIRNLAMGVNAFHQQLTDCGMDDSMTTWLTERFMRMAWMGNAAWKDEGKD
jgi:hypothetical protein